MLLMVIKCIFICIWIWDKVIIYNSTKLLNMQPTILEDRTSITSVQIKNRLGRHLFWLILCKLNYLLSYNITPISHKRDPTMLADSILGPELCRAGFWIQPTASHFSPVVTSVFLSRFHLTLRVCLLLACRSVRSSKILYFLHNHSWFRGSR